MKTKLLNLGLILASFIVYFEWGGDNRNILLGMELEIFSKFIDDPLSVLHPFIVIPFIGQLLLVITLFQKKPGRMLSLVGLVAISFLLTFVFFISVIDLNIRILCSILPFIILGVLTVQHHRVKKPALPDDA